MMSKKIYEFFPGSRGSLTFNRDTNREQDRQHHDRQNHNRLLTCYSDIGIPPYLLKILASYLKNRKMIVQHNGASSSIFELPGGGPQGTNLGILNFLVYVNSCGVPLTHLADSLGSSLQEEIHHTIMPLPSHHISSRHNDPSSRSESSNFKLGRFDKD